MSTKTQVNLDSVQTLSNKTLTAPIVNAGTCGANPTLPLGIATKQYVDTVVVIPTGIQLPYGGAAAPAGWLPCDGSAISRTTYAALFAVIGTTYGPGDGSTTFNVPDKRSRFSLGAGHGTGLSNRTRGTRTGTEAPVGQHTHVVTDPGHSHGGNVDSGDNAGAQGFTVGNDTIIGVPSAGTGISLQLAGSVDAMPPYEVDLWIIKT